MGVSHSARELWLAFFAILIISGVYLFVVISQGGIPAARELFGHSLGIAGFVLMLMTETLYTLRKRSRSARWGRISLWLQFHIFTGLVGPYMVLLHTSWKFHGLAGIVALMTLVVVGSGFFGRYIYTAIPRTADGFELEAGQIQSQIEVIGTQIKSWLERNPGPQPGWTGQLLSLSVAPAGGSMLTLLNPFEDLGYRLDFWFLKRGLDKEARHQAVYLGELVRQRHRLLRQRMTLAQARRLLALWHTLHVPLGLALFTAAFIHIGAAIYYATLLR
jgi:hypothetical protein